MRTYKIQDREAGNIIESELTLESALEMLAKFESDDRNEGIYSPDFYEVVENFPV